MDLHKSAVTVQTAENRKSTLAVKRSEVVASIFLQSGEKKKKETKQVATDENPCGRPRANLEVAIKIRHKL